jgi:hypothetical protein
LEFLIDNIFAVFGNQIFQQTVGMSIGTKFAPLFAGLFFYCYEAKFIQIFLHEKNKPLAEVVVAFNSTIRYIDDVFSISFIHISIIYTPNELEIKDITESSTSASYLDVF